MENKKYLFVGKCQEETVLNELQLYLHVPFCVKKCEYCDFLSFPVKEQSTFRKEYVAALCAEIRENQEMARSYRIITIFIGGGTPSLLTVPEITEVFHTLHKVFAIADDAEISIEINPGTVSKEKLTAYHNLGINRLSIGLQSANDEELRHLGRIHTWEEFNSCFAMAREAGFDNINIDVMSALPGQSVSSYERTLQRVVACHPEHISAYSLILEENTPFYERYANHPECLTTEEDDRQMYHRTKEILKQQGYLRYEISNYAREGCECRHNMGYWQRKEYLGLGLSAASLIGLERFKNTDDACLYSSHSSDLEQIRTEREVLSTKAQMEEFMFLGLRKEKGIDKRVFLKDFAVSYGQVYGQVTEKLVKKGLLMEDGEYIRLTECGMDVSNLVFSEFLF